MKKEKQKKSVSGVVPIQRSSTPAETPHTPAPSETPSTSRFSDKQKVWIGIGTGVGVLVLLLGVWAAVGAPGKEKLFPLFGIFPRAGERTAELRRVQKPESTFSGQECENYNRRPIAVMLASDTVARPVSGFAKADMVYELPVLVNGITRLMAIYQCEEPTDIGSIRSARHDFLFLAKGADAVIAHWGGSYHALNRIRFEGLIDSIDALGNPNKAYFRKSTLPAPYNGFTTYERLWNALVSLGYRETVEIPPYAHQNDAPESARPPGGTLTIDWPGSMRVRYEYDPATNTYQRFWGADPAQQVDGEDATPIAPKVVVIMRADQRHIRSGEPYNDVDVEGEGDLEVYQNGQVIIGRWKKSEIHKQDPVHFLDGDGRNIPFVRGQVWVEVVEPGREVTWTVAGEDSPASGENVPL